MTDYRPLEDWEKQRYEKSLAERSEELEAYTYEAENKERLLDKGLTISYREARYRINSELKQLQAQITETNFIIEDCKNKLEKGAPTIEETNNA